MHAMKVLDYYVAVWFIWIKVQLLWYFVPKRPLFSECSLVVSIECFNEMYRLYPLFIWLCQHSTVVFEIIAVLVSWLFYCYESVKWVELRLFPKYFWILFAIIDSFRMVINALLPVNICCETIKKLIYFIRGIERWLMKMITESVECVLFGSFMKLICFYRYHTYHT